MRRRGADVRPMVVRVTAKFFSGRKWQRGSMETTVCYSADSGNEVWKQQIESRFEDSPCVNRQCGASVHRRS